jgi:predicted DsbA family dithiol-disulfide isomerase
MTQNGTAVRIRHFTDPMCPFAFSAERQRLRLRWLYGDQLGWTTHMVVLAEERRPDFPPERLAAGRKRLYERYGMPMAWTPPPAVAASVDACRAVIAAREHGEEQRCGALLRRLRVLNFSGLALDAPETIDRAATEAGIDPEELSRWTREPAVEAALAADKRASRSPSPASRAQDYKLGGPPEERRYTCPSYEIERTTPSPPEWPTAERVDLPGFRPVEAYEAALANLAPELTRRPDPAGVEDVLAWAGMPLATAEVAAVMDIEPTDAREALARAARFEPVGADGYWTLA